MPYSNEKLQLNMLYCQENTTKKYINCPKNRPLLVYLAQKKIIIFFFLILRLKCDPESFCLLQIHS